MERIFGAMWIAVGRIEDIAGRGAFVRRDVGGASILIVGDGRGAARAFHNVCRHRGTRLCDAEHGTLAGSIQCPYHAWTYDLTGRLIGAPLMDEVEGFDARGLSAALRQLRRVGRARFHQSVGATAAARRSSLAICPTRFAPWRMSELRRCAASPTTCAPTGS